MLEIDIEGIWRSSQNLFFLPGYRQVAYSSRLVQLPPGVPAWDDLHQRPAGHVEPTSQRAARTPHRGRYLHHWMGRWSATVSKGVIYSGYSPNKLSWWKTMSFFLKHVYLMPLELCDCSTFHIEMEMCNSMIYIICPSNQIVVNLIFCEILKQRTMTVNAAGFNSLWPSGIIWQQGSRSTLAQVMACCLMAPSHYLNQCWLIISEVLRHSTEGNVAGNAPDIYHWYDFENDSFKITTASPRSHWVNSLRPSDAYMRQYTNHHWFR